MYRKIAVSRGFNALKNGRKMMGFSGRVLGKKWYRKMNENRDEFLFWKLKFIKEDMNCFE
jgi:hypothetical protein